jgi:hypothetical protein
MSEERGAQNEQGVAGKLVFGRVKLSSQGDCGHAKI